MIKMTLIEFIQKTINRFWYVEVSRIFWVSASTLKNILQWTTPRPDTLNKMLWNYDTWIWSVNSEFISFYKKNNRKISW